MSDASLLPETRLADAAVGTPLPKGFAANPDGEDGSRVGTNIAFWADWRDFFAEMLRRHPDLTPSVASRGMRRAIAEAALMYDHPDSLWSDAEENGEDEGWLKFADAIIAALPATVQSESDSQAERFVKGSENRPFRQQIADALGCSEPGNHPECEADVDAVMAVLRRYNIVDPTIQANDDAEKLAAVRSLCDAAFSRAKSGEVVVVKAYEIEKIIGGQYVAVHIDYGDDGMEAGEVFNG